MYRYEKKHCIDNLSVFSKISFTFSLKRMKTRGTLSKKCEQKSVRCYFSPVGYFFA